jgi:uncharacterized protein YxjI
MDLQSQNQFLLVQQLTLLVNRYNYFLFTNGVEGERIAHAEQKRFAFYEQMTIWTDETRETTLFNIKAEKVLNVHGKFFIRDAEGKDIGYLAKEFGASLLRSTWKIYDPNDTLLFTASEKSPAIAIARRIMQFVPFLGDIAGFVPFNFVFEKDGQAVGGHHRVWGSLNDRYLLEVTDALAGCDRRLLLALGITLDALQDR